MRAMKADYSQRYSKQKLVTGKTTARGKPMNLSNVSAATTQLLGYKATPDHSIDHY